MPTTLSTTTTFDFDTLAVHGGQSPDPTTGALLTPIHQSTTYAQERVGVDKGYTYSRSANPTVAALERALGVLDEAPPAVAFSTGMAAISGLAFGLLRAGDHVVVSHVVYGGTFRFVRQILEPLGVRATFVDTTSIAALRAALTQGAKLVLIETPANPTLVLTDVAVAARAAHDAGALLAVDNTFLTPFAQRVLDLGADVAVYSTTKYLEGHNATVGGALVARDATLLERFRFVRNALGTIQAPFDAWLTLRGLKTLPLRFERQAQSARTIAEWLERDRRVVRVAYPTLASFPQQALALAQQRNGGALVSFEVAGGVEASLRFMNALELVTRAENLGAVESLVTHPATMTHASLPPEERARLGITDGLVRLSVGVESVDDLVSDLDSALERAQGA